jgi:hypothetical protein
MLSHTNLKSQQPFALLTENFGSSPAKTENRYSDLISGQKSTTPNSCTDSNLLHMKMQSK